MTLTRKGWNSLKPITAPEQMSTPIHWNPMSDDWKRWIDSHQVYNGESRFSKEMLDAMKALHDKILGFGGDEVCMTAYDEDAVKTLSRGQFFYGSSYMRKGQPSQCHANSAYFGSEHTPIGSYQLTEKEIRAVQAALRSENYIY